MEAEKYRDVWKEQESEWSVGNSEKLGKSENDRGQGEQDSRGSAEFNGPV